VPEAQLHSTKQGKSTVACSGQQAAIGFTLFSVGFPPQAVIEPTDFFSFAKSG
jgi:hypothetical protein